MNFQEFMDIISCSSREEWIYDDDYGTYVYRNNIAITMYRDYDNQIDFQEGWATDFPDSSAQRLIINLCYMGNIIHRFYTASVDGARMNIPYPRLSDMTISIEQYNIGRIVNIQECNVNDDYDRYLRRASITVRE